MKNVVKKLEEIRLSKVPTGYDRKFIRRKRCTPEELEGIRSPVIILIDHSKNGKFQYWGSDKVLDLLMGKEAVFFVSCWFEHFAKYVPQEHNASALGWSKELTSQEEFWETLCLLAQRMFGETNKFKKDFSEAARKEQLFEDVIVRNVTKRVAPQIIEARTPQKKGKIMSEVPSDTPPIMPLPTEPLIHRSRNGPLIQTPSGPIQMNVFSMTTFFY